MKKFVVIFFIVSVSILKAQETALRISIGGNFNLSNTGEYYSFGNKRPLLGYNTQIGVYQKFKKNVFINPSLMFASKGTFYDLIYPLFKETIESEIIIDAKSKEKEQFNYLILPIRIGHQLYLSDRFRIDFHYGGFIGYAYSISLKGVAEGIYMNGEPTGRLTFKTKYDLEEYKMFNTWDAGILGGATFICQFKKKLALFTKLEYQQSIIRTVDYRNLPEIYSFYRNMYRNSTLLLDIGIHYKFNAK